MLTIWGRANSINVQKVLWTVHELDLPHRRIDAGGPFGVVDDPHYRAMNPNGRIPVIDDNGFVLWESNAIVRYLCAKHAAGTLWPTDLHVRADADRWMDWQTTALSDAMMYVFWGLVRPGLGRNDPALIAESTTKSQRLVDMLDVHLAGRDYVAGNAFTMGDIAVGCAVHRWSLLPLDRRLTPRVDAYLARLMARPASGLVLLSPLT